MPFPKNLFKRKPKPAETSAEPAAPEDFNALIQPEPVAVNAEESAAQADSSAEEPDVPDVSAEPAVPAGEDSPAEIMEPELLTEEDFEDGGKSGKRRGGFLIGWLQAIPTKTYVVILVFLAVITVAGAVFLITRVSALVGVNEKTGIAGRVIINNDKLTDNMSNYEYLDLEITLGENRLILKKLSLDNRASVLYFDKNFDFEKYEITMKDNYGRIYGVDLSYFKPDGTANFPKGMVRFAPLGLGVKSFTLSFADLATNEKVDFEFLLQVLYTLKPEKVVSGQIFIKDADGRILGSISGLALSSTASTIYFNFDETTPADITVRESAGTVPLLRQETLIYQMTEKAGFLGRVDFQPLANLTGKVDIVFSGMFMPLPYNERFSAISLLGNTTDPEREVSFEIDGFHITLERIFKVGERYVMVYHCEDENMAKPDGGDALYNRKEVRLDAKLIMTLPDGKVVTLEGESKSKRIGSDMSFYFSGSEFKDEINDGRFTDFELSITAAYINTGDATVTIDLDTYMSQQLTVADYLATYYMAENQDKTGYTAQTLAYQLTGGRSVNAVIIERWKENGGYKTVLREISGFADEAVVRIETDRIIPRLSSAGN